MAYRFLLIRSVLGEGKFLSNYGMCSVEILSDEIVRLLDGEDAIILSSTAHKSVQCAKIIADKLGVNYQAHEEFFSDGRNKIPDYREAFKLIKSNINKARVIIVVTHLSFSEDFLNYFCAKEFGKKIETFGIDPGCMWHLEWSDGEPILKLVNPYKI